MAQKKTAKKKKSPEQEREERLSKICAAINKGDFGGANQDAVTYLGSREVITIQRFSSECPALDWALGGGWPEGRFIELFGPESGGKTTLLLHAMASYQKTYPDRDVGFIDTEYAFDEEYAAALGVNTKYLIVCQPDSGKQALNVGKQLIQLGVGLVGVDSVAALTTEEELAGDLGDITVGAQARLLSPAMRQLAAEVGKRRATIIWTNQLREKIGVTYGDKTTTPGGRALRHYASVRVNIARIASVKEGPKDAPIFVANKVRANVKKNKTAPPFRRADFYIAFGTGIDREGAILDMALDKKIAFKRGSYIYTWNSELLGQGRAAALEFMRENPNMTDEMEKRLEDPDKTIREAALEQAEAEATEAKEKAKKGSGTRKAIKVPKAAQKAKEGATESPDGEARVPVTDPDALGATDDDVSVDDV
jgi:recombination protein RecA